MHRAWAAALLASIFCSLRVRAAANQTFDDSGFGWLFEPPVCPLSCDGSVPGAPRSWWQLANIREPKFLTDRFSGTETATNVVGASATLQFRGTDIWYFGSKTPFGGTMNISLDGDVDVVSSVLPAGSQILRQQVLWSAHDLDPTIQHVFKLTKVGGNIVDIDRVEIALAEAAPAPSTTDPTTSQTDAPSAPGGSPSGLKVGAIISVVVCGLFVLAAILFLFWCRRRRHGQRRRSYNKVQTRGDVDRLTDPSAPFDGSQNMSQASVMAIHSRENGSMRVAQATDGTTTMTTTMSELTSTATQGPIYNATLRPPQDGEPLRYAAVRTVTMHRVPEDATVPEYASGSSGTMQRLSPGQFQSTSASGTEVLFRSHRNSPQSQRSSDIDDVALAIQRDRWPQPPSHVPIPMPLSPTGTITVGMMDPPTTMDPRTTMESLYAAAYPSLAQDVNREPVHHPYASPSAYSQRQSLTPTATRPPPR